MQLLPHVWEPPLLEDQRDDLSQQSQWPMVNTGHGGSSAFPYGVSSKPPISVIVSTAILAVVLTVLAAYVCLHPRGMQKSGAQFIRRLASSDDDECQDLLASEGTATKKEEVVSSPSPAGSGGPGSGKTTESRKRSRRRSNADDEVEQAKKPLIGDTQDITSSTQSSSEALALVYGEPSSSEQPTPFFPEHPEPTDFFENQQRSADTEEAAEEEVSKATLQGAVSQELNWLQDYVEAHLGADDVVDEWFLDHLLDPSSALLPGMEADTSEEFLEHDHGESSHRAHQVTAEPAWHLEGKLSQPEPSPILPTPTAHTPTSAGVSFDTWSSPDRSSLEAREQLTSYSQGFPSAPTATPSSPPSHSQSFAGVLQPEVSSGRGTPFEHPFYRLPRAVPSQHLEPFDYYRARYSAFVEQFPVVMQQIRALLIKPELQHSELQSLIQLAELLVRNSFTLGRFRRPSVSPSELFEPFARRFLVLDALWCICEVVGPAMKKEEWWLPLVHRLLDLPTVKLKRRPRRPRIATRLRSALEVFATGKRPEAQEIIDLKREIFCSKSCPYFFRSSEFDAWRADGNC